MSVGEGCGDALVADMESVGQHLALEKGVEIEPLADDDIAEETEQLGIAEGGGVSIKGRLRLH